MVREERNWDGSWGGAQRREPSISGECQGLGLGLDLDLDLDFGLGGAAEAEVLRSGDA